MTQLQVAYLFFGLAIGLCVSLVAVSVWVLWCSRRYYYRAQALHNHCRPQPGRTLSVQDVNQMLTDAEWYANKHHNR